MRNKKHKKTEMKYLESNTRAGHERMMAGFKDGVNMERKLTKIAQKVNRVENLVKRFAKDEQRMREIRDRARYGIYECPTCGFTTAKKFKVCPSCKEVVWWVGERRGHRLHGFREGESQTLCGIKFEHHSGIPDFTQSHIECLRCLKVLKRGKGRR